MVKQFTLRLTVEHGLASDGRPAGKCLLGGEVRIISPRSADGGFASGMLSGPELVKLLHTREPDLLVLYTSGYAAGLLGDRGQLHADEVLLEKPFTRDGLLAAIDGLLQRP